MASTHRFKVGIDFGTTFSGVAYIDTNKPNDIVSIMNWPGEPKNFEKVPSEISYTAAGEVHKWGYEIKDGDERLAWFKLLLDPAQYSSSHSSTLSRTLDLIPTNPRSKKPADVVADYLSCLRKHTLETLAKTYGKSFMDAIPIDYTLTVPAMWSDTAKSLTLEAAVVAGFGSKDKIELMSEPDAAAAWTLLKDIQPMYLKEHEVFVVVDCGGGTVDLISYEVMTIEPTFTVKECADGKGALCGSMFLNQRFEDLVISRVGKRSFDQMKTRSRNRMMKEFEQFLKRVFTNSEEDDIFICTAGGLPDDPAIGIEGGEFTLTREDMLDIFDPVINQIVPLVQQQIDMVEAQHQGETPISAVLLVGGFGASQYLYQRLRKELTKGKGADRSPPEVLHTLNAWSAVARGASLGIHITSRKARRHYGTEYCDFFKFGKHPVKNLVICALTGEHLCAKCMNWYIHYGDQVSEDDPISIGYLRAVPVEDEMIFIDDLYECTEHTAPEYSNHPDNGTVRKLCAIVSDLSDVPKSCFTKKFSEKGEPYYEVIYQLVITIKSATLVFHLEFNGQKYGSATAKYLHDFNVTHS